MTQVLIIEDEKELSNVLKAYLERAGFDVMLADRGDQGIALWQENKPDMVLLDLNLPGIDGIDIAKRIRQTNDTPIIMVTARVEEVDRLLGLELGADDYITKPFSPREVVARVKAVLRRVEKLPSDHHGEIKLADLKINPETHLVKNSGQTIELTPTEFSLLLTMVQHPGRVFSRLQLLEASQGVAYEGYERSVDAHIKNLRAKLGDDSRNPKYIETVFGLGYRFKMSEK